MARRKQSDSAPLQFEQAIEQLERIIQRIESGEAGLEQSLAEYETGMQLIHHCRSILDRAESKIEKLTADAEGRLRIDQNGSTDDESEEDKDEADDVTDDSR